MPNRIGSQFGELLQSGEDSDLALLVGEQRFPVHKLVLKVRSPYFKAMLNSGMQESRQSEVKIELPPRGVELLLPFIYTCAVQWENVKTVTDLQSMSTAASYFQMSDFKEELTKQGPSFKDLLKKELQQLRDDSEREEHLLKLATDPNIRRNIIDAVCSKRGLRVLGLQIPPPRLLLELLSQPDVSKHVCDSFQALLCDVEHICDEYVFHYACLAHRMQTGNSESLLQRILGPALGQRILRLIWTGRPFDVRTQYAADQYKTPEQLAEFGEKGCDGFDKMFNDTVVLPAVEVYGKQETTDAFVLCCALVLQECTSVLVCAINKKATFNSDVQALQRHILQKLTAIQQRIGAAGESSAKRPRNS